MAENILKKITGTEIFVDSVGIKLGDPDPFMHEVMQEIGINCTRHKAKLFTELYDDNFDLIIALSPESFHHAVELTRTMACEACFWNIFDPSITEGSRNDRLLSYRLVRDKIYENIKEMLKFYEVN